MQTKVSDVDFSFKRFLSARRKRINSLLLQNLKTVIFKSPKRFGKAIQYAVLNGGKRIRPLLVYAVGEMYGAKLEVLEAPAIAIELIHSFSLVHDDLPAMDDDNLRRGKPTCHVAFNEATAILVGDALAIAAFQILSEEEELSAEQKMMMIKILSQSSGSQGMAGGQYIDLHVVGKRLSVTALEKMYLLKTGALIQAAIRLGAIAANVTDKKTWQCLDQYARNIGLAFQIQDDILNIESTVWRFGKNIGTDRERNKITYPDLVGIEKSKAKVKFLWQQTEDVLQELGAKKSILYVLTKHIMERDF